jgi:hypothetical protein
MVQCQMIVQNVLSKNKKEKKFISTFIIQDDRNFILVEPNNEKSEATIIVNQGWKHTQIYISREEGNRIDTKTSNFQNGSNNISLLF